MLAGSLCGGGAGAQAVPRGSRTGTRPFTLPYPWAPPTSSALLLARGCDPDQRARAGPRPCTSRPGGGTPTPSPSHQQRCVRLGVHQGCAKRYATGVWRYTRCASVGTPGVCLGYTRSVPVHCEDDEGKTLKVDVGC